MSSGQSETPAAGAGAVPPRVNFRASLRQCFAVALESLAANPRVAGIVSRGGSLLARWMGHHGLENPLYEPYDRLLEICRQHDVTLSLGDGAI